MVGTIFRSKAGRRPAAQTLPGSEPARHLQVRPPFRVLAAATVVVLLLSGWAYLYFMAAIGSCPSVEPRAGHPCATENNHRADSRRNRLISASSMR